MASRAIPISQSRQKDQAASAAQLTSAEAATETSPSPGSRASPATTWLLWTSALALLAFSLAVGVYCINRDWVTSALTFGTAFILARLFFTLVLHL